MKFLPLLCLLLTGCAHTVYISQIPEAVRRGFYAARDAAHAGKPELALRYMDAAAPLIPPPKVRLSFTPAVRAPQVPSLFETPGATAAAAGLISPREEQDVETFELVTAPAQQIAETDTTARLVKENQAQAVKLASDAKYKSIVWLGIALVIFVVAAAIFLALVKFGIVTGGVAAKIAAKLP